jgi:hypothetical protein
MSHLLALSSRWFSIDFSPSLSFCFCVWKVTVVITARWPILARSLRKGGIPRTQTSSIVEPELRQATSPALRARGGRRRPPLHKNLARSRVV